MPDGHPDLQGTYDVATATPLERPAGQSGQLTMEQAQRTQEMIAQLLARENRPLPADRNAPPMGGDGSPGNSGNVGAYNLFWIGLPSRVTVLDGAPRSSIVIDPVDGRIPPLTDAARMRMSRLETAAPGSRPGAEKPDAADGPERRSLSERCLVGTGGTSGTPILPYFYNNLHQIVQTADELVIFSEMVHDARVVRIGGQHPAPSVRKWLGDSIASWDGDTLVIDTTNFADDGSLRPAGAALHVTERLSRIDASTLRYRFTVEDSSTWTTSWSGEYLWPATRDRIFEYACHEGNHALEHILRGARAAEKMGSAAADRW